MRFRATVELGGQTATGVVVPPEVVAQLGAGKRPPVRATINGYTYRSSIASMGRRFLLSVSADVRQQAGNDVDVDVELDTEPREVTVPPDFAAALDAQPQAKSFSMACPTATDSASCCRSRMPRHPRRGNDASTRRSSSWAQVGASRPVGPYGISAARLER